jgi:hypothetical protein
MVAEAGTSGGEPVTNGGPKRLALVMAFGFLVILIAITIGNAESLISDFAAAGVHETRLHVWIWESTSVLAWVSTLPVIWWAVARIRPPRIRWPIVLLSAVLGLPLASGWHVGLMIGLRHTVYAAMGETYRFEGGIADPFLYEFRKDIATYLQFVCLAVLAQWLLARAAATSPSANGAVPPVSEQQMFIVTDGTMRHVLPIETIEHIAAAGNYVEVHAEGRTLLHRATLASIEDELGATFVRVHRSRLINRKAIRRFDIDRSGDFSVQLASGTVLGGSRRYRERLHGFERPLDR